MNVLSFIWGLTIYGLNAYAILSIKEFISKKEVIITLRIGLIVIVFLINSNVLPLVTLRYLDYLVLVVYFIYLIKKRKRKTRKWV